MAKAKKSNKPTKNPFAEKIGSGMAKTKGAIKPGKAKGAPLKVKAMPTEKVQGGKAVGTAHGATFGKPGKQSKGKKKSLKK
jgi:hypothetical protein